jgi:hypothetical protein
MLAARHRAALESGDLEVHRDAHVKLIMSRCMSSWFYSPAAVVSFAEQFPASYAHNPLVGKYVFPPVDYPRLRAQLARISSRLLVMYDYQDFEPVVHG